MAKSKKNQENFVKISKVWKIMNSIKYNTDPTNSNVKSLLWVKKKVKIRP